MTSTDFDTDQFLDNVDANWSDVIAKLPYQHVAWSMDGSRILAHSPSIEGLISELNRLGITDFVADYLVPGDDIGIDASFDVGSAVAAEASPEPGV